MTMPLDDGSGSLLAQILIEQGKQGKDIAVILEKLNDVPDHETRIRALERWRWSLPASVLAAAGSGVAAWLAYIGH